MKLSRFPNGGYVIHKALPDLNVSAWFNSNGVLVDCELINSRGQSRKPSKSTIAMIKNRWENLPAPRLEHLHIIKSHIK